LVVGANRSGLKISSAVSDHAGRTGKDQTIAAKRRSPENPMKTRPFSDHGTDVTGTSGRWRDSANAHARAAGSSRSGPHPRGTNVEFRNPRPLLTCRAPAAEVARLHFAACSRSLLARGAGVVRALCH
jgi:hypothetical protein